jgi:hypothetical protein
MQSLKPLLIAGAAVAGLAVLAPALARELNSHKMTVRVPGGGVATIEYSGDVAPKIRFLPVAGSRLADPFAWSAAFDLPSFAALDRMAADMDRQMDVMLHHAEMLSRMPQDDSLRAAVMQGLPPGTTSFSMIQTSTGHGVCTKVTRITQGAPDAKPQVVSQTSGCGDHAHDAASADPSLKHIAYPAPAAPEARSAL